MGRKGTKSADKNIVKWSKGTTNVRVGQSSNATINQGGNAFAINATEIGVVRIRPGAQG
ncbi:hypothetical protein [Paenibacillus sp. JDR-2]|uniref:hypothetical protein n=1 Tax=Paenibacillus sp. (strain JDR-2) TaxID=324057 RepID=UPI0001664806|nr:hypothetical protein [Paenibacillus sp. JDR-2]ACT03953.1 hypothetical protein Pjdr2_5343 [Paenibacillus sp. JDR-2]